MSTPESKIKSKLDRMLKTFGADIFFFSPQAGPYGRAGIPDRIICLDGLFIAVECKADASCKPTALQNKCMDEIRRAGGRVYMVNCNEHIEEIRKMIKAHIDLIYSGASRD